jgi:urate oxidase
VLTSRALGSTAFWLLDRNITRLPHVNEVFFKMPSHYLSAREAKEQEAGRTALFVGNETKNNHICKSV